MISNFFPPSASAIQEATRKVCTVMAKSNYLLTSGSTWTSDWEDVSMYPSITPTIKSTGQCTYKLEFNTTGTGSADSVLTWNYETTVIEPPQRNTVTRQYARLVVQNTAGVDLTITAQVLLGSQTQLNSSINQIIAPDAGASIVRPMDFNLLVAEGLYQNRLINFKDGFTPTMASGNITQDLWQGSGAYTGFPLTADEGQIEVSGADVGTVLYSYLESATSTAYTFGSLSINGAGSYNLGHNIWRCNFAIFRRSNDATLTGFNVGTITVRHRNTPANVFAIIPTGYGQSQNAAYTVPFGNSAYIKNFISTLTGASGANSKGFLWYRDYNQSPRLRFQFTPNFGSQYMVPTDYLFKIPARTDFIPRIINNSANNTIAQVTYFIQLVKEH